MNDPDRLQTPPDYDFPLEEPPAKEVAAGLREGNLVLNLKATPEPAIEIFRDQLGPIKDAKNPHLVVFLSRTHKYRYYSIPFSVVAPLLGWIRLSDEKRPRWRLSIVPKTHTLVARNGPRVEYVKLLPYFNRPPAP